MKISVSHDIFEYHCRLGLYGNAGLGHDRAGKDLATSSVHRNTGNHTLWLEIPHVKSYYMISRVTSFHHFSNVRAEGGLSS